MQVVLYHNKPVERTFKELGVTSANFRGRAKTTPVNSDVIANLYAMFPDINLEWLFTGEGQMLKTDTEQNTLLLDRYTELVRENERLRMQLSNTNVIPNGQ
jgi:hypothetical protein